MLKSAIAVEKLYLTYTKQECMFFILANRMTEEADFLESAVKLPKFKLTFAENVGTKSEDLQEVRVMANKLHNKKVVINGETYASQREYARWCELKLLERAGEISNLKKQVKFVLIPAHYDMTGGKKGKCLERECAYIADFVYTDKDGHVVVEDTKGCKKGATYEVFVIKRKLMLQKYGIRVQEI